MRMYSGIAAVRAQTAENDDKYFYIVNFLLLIYLLYIKSEFLIRNGWDEFNNAAGGMAVLLCFITELTSFGFVWVAELGYSAVISDEEREKSSKIEIIQIVISIILLVVSLIISAEQSLQGLINRTYYK